MGDKIKHFVRFGHIPLLIVLQIIFIICFAVFVDYDPITAKPHGSGTYKAGKDTKGEEFGTSNEEGAAHYEGYPLFQDVHIMIFIGFGFLMTFLKKYGLSAVSLNMMIAVICLQWATLVIGWFHLHNGKIQLNLTDSMLFSDFAAAAVLITFGVVLGKTTPLQLIILALIEIVLFTVNEIIGRKYLKAIDAGDTIFVHLFGAYFGLACSRVMYNKKYEGSSKQSSARTSDMLSMVGTIFLWMFWPSFNSAAVTVPDAQHRAVLNTFFSLCASVLSSFAFSSLMNEKKKFVMEHIQNATLAGGVAIGACADLVVQPFGALIVGFTAGAISVWGFDKVSPWLQEKLHVHDTCGVHNLHGMPAVLGAILSCIMAAVATPESYGGSNALRTVYPALFQDGNIPPITPGAQAINQLIASIVTLVVALVGGALTGLLLHYIERWQHIDDAYHRGMTILRLALSVGSLTSGVVDATAHMPVDAYFDDNVLFWHHFCLIVFMYLKENVLIKVSINWHMCRCVYYS
jgi:ammonium transporter Rh